MHLDDLVLSYKEKHDKLTQRELAALEAEIRRFSPLPDRGSARDKWMVNLLGGTTYAYRNRWTLIRLEGVEALWERIENGLPFGTAIRLLRQAKTGLGTRYKTPSILRRALADELARHDNVAPEGKPTSAKPSAPSAGAPAPAARATWTSDREFWAFVRRHILEFADQNLMDVPEVERDALWSNFERDLESLIKHHQHRWYDARSSASKHVKVSKRKLNDALHVLHMDLPRRGVDLTGFQRKARQQMRTLSRIYHPDSNRGDDSFRDKYEAVIAAYSTVERWLGEQTTGDPSPETTEPRPGLRVVQGGKKE